MGWFTVFAYFAAAALCLVTWRAIRRHIRQPERGRQAVAWGAMTLLMIALGVNKELDLQSWFTAIGRAIANERGWMAQHRAIQFDFMVVLTAAAVVALVAAAWFVRRRRREYWLLLAGVTFTMTFIVLRAASFHHFDVVLRSHVAGVKVNWALELTGIAVIGAAALIRLRAIKPEQVRVLS